MAKHKHVWAHGFANKLRQLFQGIRNIPGTDTCFFIPQLHVPAHKYPTYGCICCNYQPQKEEKHCIRLTVGSNHIKYPVNKSTPTADLTTAKPLINSTISIPGDNFLGIDLTNFYLNTPIPNPEYMHLCLDIIPDEIIIHYNLCNIVTPDRWVYIKIQKGMYGLLQASILENQLLEKCLADKGYYQCQHTPGLWHHIWRNTTFCLVVDDFGIKVTNMQDMDHLVNALKEHINVTINMTGSLFCGIQLTWKYAQGHVNCHMPGYINKALTKYQHPKPITFQHAPYKASPIQYGARVHRVEVDTTQPLTPKEIKCIQDIFGTLLYYARVVDPTLLVALSQLLHDKPTAHGQWQMHVTNSSITLPLTQKQTFDTKLATWYFQYTPTPPTFQNLVVKAERQDIFTY